MRARSLALAAPLLIAAFAGCDGGTRACKDSTLFVTIKFGGSTSSANAVSIDVSIDGGVAKNTVRDRAGGSEGTVEIYFPEGYPAGKRVDVRITALENGTPRGSSTGSLPSLPAGCAALTVALDGGSPGTGGVGGTGGASAGTGGGTAGRGGAGGSTAGRGGTGGPGGTGGGTVLCPYANFDTTLEGFAINTYTDPSNLASRDAGNPPSAVWNGTEGSPTAGSIRVDAPFSDYNQYVDVIKQFTANNLQNWSGKKLHVRVKVASGFNPSPAAAGGIAVHAQSYNPGGADEYPYKNQWATLTVGDNGWNDYVFDLAPVGSFDPARIWSFGVQLNTASGSSAQKPTPAVVYIDSFAFEGSCPTGAGGTSGGAGRGGAGGTSGGAGRGGAGGTGGTGGTTPALPPCRFAGFDTTADGFGLNPYGNSGNLVLREGGAPATISRDDTQGEPTAGSIKIDAPFSEYDQYVDLTRPFPGSALQNWTGVTKLHVRVRIASGLDQSSATPPAITVYANSYNVGARGLDYYWRGNYAVLSTGTAWTDYVVALAKGGDDFDPAFVSAIGVSITSGGSVSGAPKPKPAVIYVDSFWLEGACTLPAGTFPAASTCGASWAVTSDGFVTSPGASGCWHGYAQPAGDPGSTFDPTSYAACGAGCVLKMSGTVGPANATNNYAGMAYIKVNLAQDYGSGFLGTVVPTGSGLKVSFAANNGSGLGVRAELGGAGKSWCYVITTTGPVTIPYTMFKTGCWDGTGTFYAKEPIDTFRLIAPGVATATSLNMTLTSVTDTN